MFEELLNAIKKEDTKQAISIIEKLSKEELSPKPEQEEMPLHLAAMQGLLDVVKAILGKGVDVNSLDAKGISALNYAVEEGEKRKKLDLVKHLVEQGANIDHIGGEDSYTPLACAAEQGNFEISKYLLKQGANAKYCNELYGSTILQYACDSGNEKFITYLLNNTNAKEQINELDQDGWPPISQAVMKSSTDRSELIKLFVKCKANFNYQNHEDDNKSILMRMIEDGAHPNSVLTFITEGNPDLFLEDDDQQTAEDYVNTFYHSSSEPNRKIKDIVDFAYKTIELLNLVLKNPDLEEIYNSFIVLHAIFKSKSLNSWNVNETVQEQNEDNSTKRSKEEVEEEKPPKKTKPSQYIDDTNAIEDVYLAGLGHIEGGQQ